MIEHLLKQCSEYIERTAPKISPAQDLSRRCKKMIKKLNNKSKKNGNAYMV